MKPSDLFNVATTVSRLATRFPAASRVFMRHQIDFCCGGNRSLESACVERGLVADTVLDEIRTEEDRGSVGHIFWDERPLPELIQHIVERYHHPLREELPRLLFMARKVLSVHGEKDPERLSKLVALLEGLGMEMFDHLDKEEQTLFPMILSGQGAVASDLVEVMFEEHDNAAGALEILRQLADNFQAPKRACTTWRALWAGLAALDADTREHIHLENNILLPRALGRVLD